MTDEQGTPGERLDEAIAAVRKEFDDLLQDLNAKRVALGSRVVTKVNEFSARIDELQAAWEERTRE
jgi:hypothetical protein